MGYVDRIRGKYTAKWDVQMAEMNFQTRSSADKTDLSQSVNDGCRAAADADAVPSMQILTLPMQI